LHCSKVYDVEGHGSLFMVLQKLRALLQWLCSKSSDHLASKGQLFVMEAFGLHPKEIPIGEMD